METSHRKHLRSHSALNKLLRRYSGRYQQVCNQFMFNSRFIPLKWMFIKNRTLKGYRQFCNVFYRYCHRFQCTCRDYCDCINVSVNSSLESILSNNFTHQKIFCDLELIKRKIRRNYKYLYIDFSSIYKNWSIQANSFCRIRNNLFYLII